METICAMHEVLYLKSSCDSHPYQYRKTKKFDALKKLQPCNKRKRPTFRRVHAQKYHQASLYTLIHFFTLIRKSKPTYSVITSH